MKLNSESGQKLWESHLKFKKRAKDRKVCPFPTHCQRHHSNSARFKRKKKKVDQQKKKKKNKVDQQQQQKKTFIPGSYGRRQKTVQWVSLMSKEQSTKRGRTQKMPGEQSEIRSTLWRLTMYTINIKTR